MAKEKDTSDSEPTMASVLARLAEIQASNVAVQKEQLRQTAPKSNSAGPKISMFNLRGDKDFPMPALKCEIGAPFYAKPELHAFDREEVELMNLVEPGTYPVDLTDGSVITLNVVGTKNSLTGKLDGMDFVGIFDESTRSYAPIFTHERKQIFPSLKVLLRQILGDAALDVMTMREEARLIALPAEHPDRLPVSLGA